ncbi:2-oxo acid dehydrogenase subunit E2 [Iodidimonas sp. SYSU 1G8]|uniref:2-oxo acid dehydrogenase subunit E2 n=1 Tax=Iodidimonas sp. SYSU 1G8 TaxID=3133967 RepID=UPI0031FEA315
MANIKAIIMPKWGLEMVEGTLAKWHVTEGQPVDKGQPIMDVETEKIANEVEADIPGVMRRRVAEEGQVIPVGGLLGVIADKDVSDADVDAFVGSYKSEAFGRVEALGSDNDKPAQASAGSAGSYGSASVNDTAGVSDEDDGEGSGKRASPRARKLAETLGVDINKVTSDGPRISDRDVQAYFDSLPKDKPVAAEPPRKLWATPRVKVLAKKLGVDLADLVGTGKNGRITQDDVRAYADEINGPLNEDVRSTPAVRKLAKELGVDIARVQGSGKNGRITREDVEAAAAAPKGAPAPAGTSYVPGENPHTVQPLNTMRKTIARRLTEAKQNIPHIYLTVDVELDRLLARRQKVNASADVKASVNDFIIRACGLALKHVPQMNVQYHDDGLHFFKHADISMAVSLEGGLITPIVRAADVKSVQDIAAETKDLASRARSGKLKMEEIQGGTFSISNMGMLGIRNFDAVINPPQGAILAVGKGEERIIARNGAPAVATVMTVTLSCDHRAIDGALGARFLEVFKDLIEEPLALVL